MPILEAIKLLNKGTVSVGRLDSSNDSLTRKSYGSSTLLQITVKITHCKQETVEAVGNLCYRCGEVG